MHAERAAKQIASALAWLEPEGRLNCRAVAQAQLEEVLRELQGQPWSKVRRLLSDERTLSHLDRGHEPRQAAVSEPLLRESLSRLWELSHRLRQAEGPRRLQLESLVVLEQVVCERLSAQWQSAYERVDEILSQAVRASIAGEFLNSVMRMHQGRHRQVSQGMLDLKRFYWNCRLFREGKRKGHCPYALLGLKLPTEDWWQLLQMAPEELEEKLLTQELAA